MSEYQTPASSYGYAPSPHAPYGQATSGPPPEALANQGARLAARVLDIVVIVVALGVVLGFFSLLQQLWSNTGYLIITAVLGMICSAAVLCYEPILTWKYGATLGKRTLGLRVARLDNAQNLSAGRAFGRWLSAIAMGFVPFLGLLNVLWCCWDAPYRQCLHDKAASSVVVKAR